MKEPSELALQQAMRLSVLDRWPFPVEGQIELARAIETAAGDNARFAEKIVSSFCQDGGRCPDPRHIAQRAYEISHPGGIKTGQNCETCGGTGFVTTQRMFPEWRVIRDPGPQGGKPRLDEHGKQQYEEVMVPRDYAAMCVCHARESR